RQACPRPRSLIDVELTSRPTAPPPRATPGGRRNMETRSDLNGTRTAPGFARPLAGVLAVAVGLVRLIPHPWNFTPVGAVGLFAGGRLRSWHAFALPLGLMALTDLALWGLRGPDYSPFHVTRAFVYPSILLYALLGKVLAAGESVWRIGLASVLGSLQFFL